MKKFKQFKSEQQVINEIGPFGAVMMGAMGLFGGGFAAYKMFKTAKSAIKGYRETKADKKAREQDGFTMSLKVYNPATDKEETQDFYVDPKEGNPDLEKLGYKIPRKLGGKIKAPSDDDLDKMEKEANNKAKRANAAIKRKVKNGTITDDDLTTDQQTQLGDKDKEASDKAAAKEKGEKAAASKGVKDWMGHEPTDEIPSDMEPKVREKERKELGGHKDVLAYMDRWDLDSVKGWKKWYDDPKDKDDFEYVEPNEWEKRYAKGGAAKFGKREKVGESRILKFGEFISEDVMKDLKLATKSKKDSEITLDDGADIPIDPLTASILVKYIEGLGSSEKNKTINKIQRTERAFMKVLGQAHGE